ncbi:MAG: hypothetical protein AB1782_09440 [Cyanobacteriota bacterium]
MSIFSNLFDIDRIKSAVLEEKYGIIIIILVFAFMCHITWFKWGELIFFDNARELTVPYLITQGKWLYKDIYYFYGPLLPYIFSLFIIIFGFKLHLFYISGIFISLIYSFCLYFLARMFLDKFNSTIVSLLFIIQLVFFSTGLFSYILPYSYGAVIGSLLVCLQTIFLLKHFNSNNRIFLYIAAFCCMLNLLVKQDFFFTGLISFIFYIFITPLKIISFEKKVNLKLVINKYFSYMPIKDFLSSLGMIFIPPAIVYSILGFKAGYQNIIKGIFPFELLTLKNPSVEIFVRDDLKSVATVDNIIIFIVSALLSAAIIFILTYLIAFSIDFYNKHRLKKTIISALSILIILILLLSFAISIPDLLLNLLNTILFSFVYIYSGINLWLIILLFYCIINIKKESSNQILFLAFVAFLLNYRMFYCLYLDFYSFYYLPVSLILFVYLVYKLIPYSLNKIFSLNISTLKYSTRVFFILLILVYLLFASGLHNFKNCLITTDIGSKYTSNERLIEYKTIKKVAEYIKTNTTKKDTILVYPRHLLIYLLSERLPASKYYYLVPGTTTTVNEEYSIIEDIRNNKPEFILISNDKRRLKKLAQNKYSQYQFGSKYYYKDIYYYVLSNYSRIKTFKTDSNDNKQLKIDIFKIKRNKLKKEP